MKKIQLFMACILAINFAMGDSPCTVIGGNLTTDKSKICLNESQYLNMSGHTGTITAWQMSSDNGASWSTLTTSSSNTLNQYFNTVGVFQFRVEVSCWYNDDNNNYTQRIALSNTLTVTVSDANAGNISGGNATLCTGTAPNNLTISNQFGDIEWQYKWNGGSYTSTTCGNYTSCSPPIPNGAGTYTYRAKVSCFLAATKYSNEITMQVNGSTTAAICNDADDLRKAVAKVTISGIPYNFSGYLVNHTANDGRLLFLTTSQPFTRYAPNSTALNAATFTWNEDLSSCGGGSATSITSTGCSLVATDGFFSLLQLNAAPDVPQLYYLGWDINAAGNYSSIFQSAAGIKKGRVASTVSPTTCSATISNTTDVLTETSGSNVLKIGTWTGGNTEKQGRGAPLIAANKKARGVYIGGTEANCGNGPSYFADIANASASFLNNLRNSTSETNSATVHMNYCIPFINRFGNLNQTPLKQPQVSGYIQSTENIANGLYVNYKAGTYIELNNGFVSGTNFVAEIDPCVSVISYIAYKTDDTEQDENTLPIAETKSTSNWLKIYPTILPSGNVITIESSSTMEGIELQLYDIQGKHLRSYRFNGFGEATKTTISTTDIPAGFYVFKAQNSNQFFTQKIILQ